MSDDRHTILIVDDEQDVLDSLRRTLRHENYEVLTSTSPRDALDMLQRANVDILISDIDMPEMTGLELIGRARKRYPDVVRILLTGDASIQSALEAINEGSVHKYLTKPWSARDLRDTLRTTISGLEALRQRAASLHAADRYDEQLRELEQRYAGITTVSRIDGAYLLNDMRVVEGLARFGEEARRFAASQWLPASPDATQDMRKPSNQPERGSQGQ